MSFNPLLRPIQLPWLNALSVRTLQTDAFLMSVQVGQNSSSVLSVSNGFLFDLKRLRRFQLRQWFFLTKEKTFTY